MFQDTFDNPSTKFWFVIPKDGRAPVYDDDGQLSDIAERVRKSDFYLIPFEDVDELELEKALLSYAINGIGLYTGFQLNKLGSETVATNSRFILFCRINDTNDKTETVDKIFTRVFEQTYSGLYPENQKSANCFFQRYMDGSYKGTQKRIDTLGKK